MSRPLSIADSLAKVLDDSPRPIYFVDSQRRIVYCNLALADWMDLERKRIIGRRVEYHSEDSKTDAATLSDVAPLTDLCPPPYALAGQPGKGTISCQARDGRMLHRAADFVPLVRATESRRPHATEATPQSAVLVLLAAENLSAQDLANEFAAERTSDELHRTIKQFRRGRARQYSIQALLGGAQALQKVRAQVEAAARSGANALICGRPGTGRRQVALAIHYHSNSDDEGALLPLNCQLLTDDLFLHTFERLSRPQTRRGPKQTLLLENLESMPAKYQSLLVDSIRQNRLDGRIIATADFTNPAAATFNKSAEATESRDSATEIERTLIESISTLTIRVPRLVERLEDLPILAQFFLESCNRANSKQVGGLRSDALDSLALYSWPGELDQLREMIELAHTACTSHVITSSDLPPIFYQAFQATAHKRHQAQPIDLDELLASIEKEAITRALTQTGGNKSEAAALLGMTRPRLYRRLVQLGLVSPELETDSPIEEPEFIEHDPTE